MRMECVLRSAESFKIGCFAAVAVGLGSVGGDRSPPGHPVNSDELPQKSQIILPVLTKPQAD